MSSENRRRFYGADGVKVAYYTKVSIRFNEYDSMYDSFSVSANRLSIIEGDQFSIYNGSGNTNGNRGVSINFSNKSNITIYYETNSPYHQESIDYTTKSISIYYNKFASTYGTIRTMSITVNKIYFE